MTKLLPIALFAILCATTYAQKCKNGDIVDLSPGRSCLFGYNFDGPVERGLWRSIWWIRSGGQVTDCNSYCKFRGNARGTCESSVLYLPCAMWLSANGDLYAWSS
ncbi:hypothetical protein AAVH_14036 [Aphelenchoides avenae]|nr:hypothetical protein AAVH_14036 [Aphelenchus avenae]